MTKAPGSSRAGIDWLVFALLGFFWGSSYLFIKIGVDEGLQPFTLVMLRLLIGSALLIAVVLIARERLPRERASTPTSASSASSALRCRSC